ncbi:hypothetical protein MCHLDSM_06099 [Mycolicibacterium chlorophenolicum]|uniref:Uncharacterized protein n=2 Tax=Mycolicibacterium chlorophenolicum TaxID=37916 RepID=A0A0J6VGI1_9MYCO|nr:hypothetical protein MCHLDSM_06099 [Mycolicibacterium chlorophenolicum]
MLAYARRHTENQDTNRVGIRQSSKQTTGLFTAEPAATIAVSVDGSPAGPVAIAGDGIAYQVTTRSSSSSDVTRVSVLTPDGQLLATSRAIAGLPEPDCQAVGRPDGSLVLVTLNDKETLSTISIINGNGSVVRTTTVLGRAESMTSSASGAVFVDTSWTIPFFPTGYGDLATLYVSPQNTVRTFAPSGVTAGPDGTAYLVSSRTGIPTQMIRPSGRVQRIVVPFGSNAGTAPVFAGDGTAYWTVGTPTLFGGEKTRLYTLDDTLKVTRTVTGFPARAVVTAQGVVVVTQTGYQQTAYQGTTYYSWIADNTVVASQAIDGASNSQVTPGGTVYAVLDTPAQQVTSVLVMDSGRTRGTVTLPGTLASNGPLDVDGSGPRVGEQGYVTYESAGRRYLAVLDPDGTVARTVLLPDDASYTSPVFFGPDGAPYVFLAFGYAQGEVASQQVLAVASDTYTPMVSGPVKYDDPRIQFSPDGTGYLLGSDNQSGFMNVIGFDAPGTTPVALTDTPIFAGRILVFAPDGTAYTFLAGIDGVSLYALSPAGATEVLPLTYFPLVPVVVAPDGTLYLTAHGGGDNTVVTLIPPTAVR